MLCPLSYGGGACRKPGRKLRRAIYMLFLRTESTGLAREQLAERAGSEGWVARGVPGGSSRTRGGRPPGPRRRGPREGGGSWRLIAITGYSPRIAEILGTLTKAPYRRQESTRIGDPRPVRISSSSSGLILAGSCMAVALSRGYRTATPMAIGAMTTWASLFAWRVSVARTVGANLWLVPFVVVVMPLTVGLPLAVRAVVNRRHRNR